MADLTIKQGASLQLQVAMQNDDGSPFDPTGTIASSEIRDSLYKLIDTLDLTPTAALGVFSVLQPTDTWPTGLMLIDIKLIKAGVIVKTATFSLLVQTPVTE